MTMTNKGPFARGDVLFVLCPRLVLCAAHFIATR
eukprot:CAMPEP_0183442610 /NCGR_PEP_ID=MMETSP0370-20130417/88833_1 /TAXON_ID=268820 /ORGANISM="Peridinium aciculiferum, Strain PAER-2" /LENGTH=33 /DNA_ID= /DNA_START= /DNA_END= /DNA_ORIENTATION=